MLIPANKSLSAAVCFSGPDDHSRALRLARKLNMELVQGETEKYGFFLSYSAEGLVLKQTGNKNMGPIRVDFTSGAMRYRIRHGGGRRQALARALGLKKGWQPSVIDATAGLGRDGFIMAGLGCRVHIVERLPVLAALLEDGLERAAKSKQTAAVTSTRLHLTCADSRDFLQNLKQQDYPDIIYLDPMYPARTKSSLVKKEMRILRNLAGDDLDAAELLALGLNRALNRVVVKRPRLAPPLSTMPPSHQVTGKTSRFDVYMVKKSEN